MEVNNLVSEIYSPPRVTRAAGMLKKLGISPGFALDITVEDEDGTPWDFTLKTKREKAAKMVIHTEPDLVVGSPMCTVWHTTATHSTRCALYRDPWLACMPSAAYCGAGMVSPRISVPSIERRATLRCSCMRCAFSWSLSRCSSCRSSLDRM